MLGVLTKEQSLHILQSEVFGRIGCCTDEKMYVVPVTYAFDGKFIYAHSKEGMKIKLMRKNLNVCFQVDRIENMANWRSIIVWGKFEELKNHEYDAGMKILKDRFAPILLSESVKPTHDLEPAVVVKQRKAIVFRISVDEITGRFEKTGVN